MHPFEGTVNQVMGNGIIALFGAPLADEDHTVCACYAEDARHAHGVTAQIRISLNSTHCLIPIDRFRVRMAEPSRALL